MNRTSLHAVRRTLPATALLLFLPAAPAQPPSSASAAQAQRHLLELTVPDDMDTNVPGPVRDAIVDFKQALATQTDAIVTRLPATITAAAAKQRLSQALPPPAVGKISQEEALKRLNSDAQAPVAGLYGGDLT